MRIIAGQWRGLKLADVGEGDAAAHLRPTSDRVRESLFNIIGNQGGVSPLVGARVLDLFAGTGALGLEALSRGAAHVTFVDDGAKSQALIRQNIAKCRANEATKLLTSNACRLATNNDAPCNVVFLDPPYGKGLGERALTSALDNGWIAPNALIVWEESSPQLPPKGFFLKEHRRFGETHITFAEPA